MNENVKSEIIDLLGSNELDKGQKLINRIKPQSLFKYRSGIAKNNHTEEFWDIEALCQKKLWMSLATKLDDPYDCSVLIKEDVAKIVEVLRETTGDFMDEKYITHVERINKHTRETSMICSLTENLNDIDMWTRYANCGKGFCIEYDFDELISINALLFPVIYGDIVKSITEFRNKQKVYIDILLKKTDKLNWRSQNEWRIISNIKVEKIKNQKTLGKLIDVPKPRAIYLGYDIDKVQELKEKLVLYCKTYNVGCFLTKLSTNDVEVYTEHINI